MPDGSYSSAGALRRWCTGGRRLRLFSCVMGHVSLQDSPGAGAAPQRNGHPPHLLPPSSFISPPFVGTGACAPRELGTFKSAPTETGSPKMPPKAPQNLTTPLPPLSPSPSLDPPAHAAEVGAGNRRTPVQATQHKAGPPREPAKPNPSRHTTNAARARRRSTRPASTQGGRPHCLGRVGGQSRRGHVPGPVATVPWAARGPVGVQRPRPALRRALDRGGPPAQCSSRRLRPARLGCGSGGQSTGVCVGGGEGWDRRGCATWAPSSATRQGEEQHRHTEPREPRQEGQGRAHQTRRRGTARQERQPEQREQGTRMERMGERAHGRQRQ